MPPDTATPLAAALPAIDIAYAFFRLADHTLSLRHTLRCHISPLMPLYYATPRLITPLSPPG